MPITTTSKPRRMFGLIRISDDTEKTGLGVERQRMKVDRWVATNAATLVALIEENDVGASVQSRKPRPEFEAMLEALEAGEADGVYSPIADRLTRRLDYGHRLIELGKMGCAIVMGDLDLRDPIHREQYTNELAAAANESNKISRRVKDDQQFKREVTRSKYTGGRRLFGYQRSMEWHEDEKPLVVEMVAMVTAGASCSTVARWLNDQGVTTTQGNPWSSSAVKHLVTNPAIANILTYTPYAGKGEKRRKVPTTVIGEGTWDAIVTEEEWNAARLALEGWAQPGRKRGTQTIFHGLIVCDRCSQPMTRTTSSGRPAWACLTKLGSDRCGRMSIDARVEDHVLRLMFTKAGDVQAHRRTRVEPVDHRSIEAIEQDYADLFDMRGRMSKDAYDARLAKLDGERDKIQRAAATSPVDVIDLGNLEHVWDRLTENTKRLVMASVITEVRISASSRRAWSDDICMARTRVEFADGEFVGGT